MTGMRCLQRSVYHLGLPGSTSASGIWKQGEGIESEEWMEMMQ